MHFLSAQRKLQAGRYSLQEDICDCIQMYPITLDSNQLHTTFLHHD